MYNEEDNVDKIIRQAEDIFKKLSMDYEIIIIESGSTDETWQKIDGVIKGRENIYAFHQERREGMGSALRLGYTKCRKDLVCLLEADSPFDMMYFKKAVPILLENDCVIGYRVGAKEQNYKWAYHNMGKKGAVLRQMYHLGYILMLRLIFGLKIRDVNFSFKIFRRECIQGLNLISNGWFIDAEIILELRRKGILPVEMPVEYVDRTVGKSTVRLSTPLHMIYEMLKYIKAAKSR
jgi:glycosyltransferase involved in cell wall biosynthesis